jgi:outer membrane protein OmpA-like peptidoglycan-associated protein
MNSYRVFVAWLILFSTQVLSAQNLVPNGSFEKYQKCPDDYVTVQRYNYVFQWDTPNNGTPDYFNACSQKCGVPLNWVGSAPAFDGKGYMGIIGCMYQMDPNQIAYREYIRTKLTKPLEAGKTYYASMQIRLGMSCTVACNGMGMFFTDAPLNSVHSINYPIQPDIVYKQNDMVLDKNNWTQICGTFQAQGGESYLIIGNFLSNQEMTYQNFDENLLLTQNTSPMAYYYVDYVEVYEYKPELNLSCESIVPSIPDAFQGELTRNKKMILEHLYFEFDQSVILPESHFELDQLAAVLLQKTQLKLYVYGHTDNLGTVQYNQKLSEDRALAVRNYLLAKGVSRFRIFTQGFGSSQPVSDNTTNQGKQLNRRVEIEVK